MLFHTEASSSAQKTYWLPLTTAESGGSSALVISPLVRLSHTRSSAALLQCGHLSENWAAPQRHITCAGTNLKNRWAKSRKPEHKSNYPATQAEIHDRRGTQGATNGKTA